jgi:hypothetical protein
MHGERRSDEDPRVALRDGILLPFLVMSPRPLRNPEVNGFKKREERGPVGL